MSDSVAILNCTVTGNSRPVAEMLEWDGYKAALLCAPKESIVVNKPRTAYGPFEIEINVTENNQLRLLFKNSAGEVLCNKLISDQTFYTAAFFYRDAVKDTTAYPEERADFLGAGALAMRQALNPDIIFEPDVYPAHEYLFHLCAFALRDPAPS